MMMMMMMIIDNAIMQRLQSGCWLRKICYILQWTYNYVSVGLGVDWFSVNTWQL